MLVQATIGHGYPLNRPFGFTPLKQLADGKDISTCCPYDEDFREHFYQQFATIAKRKPKLIMVDDDFRLMWRPGKGCACKLHSARVSELLGEEMDQEKLYKSIFEEKNERVRAAFIETQRESLLGAAKMMRAGIDSVDPTIPGAFCICGNSTEFGEEIAKILAGEGNPTIVRVNNGNYTPAGARLVTRSFYYAAYQIQQLPNTDAILAETDTCPQNRYSTGAYSLHTHFTGTILEGASGAKHWLTRLSAFELKSGEMYRRVLTKYSKFYQALSDLVPKLLWLGCRVPVPARPNHLPVDVRNNEWHICVLERLGLPLYFSAKQGGALFLDGDDDQYYTDEELREIFRGTVFLSAETAENLVKRGFEKEMGVLVRAWNGRYGGTEVLKINGNPCKSQMGLMEIVPLDDAVESLSTVVHVPDGKTREPLFPGVTKYQNALGGTVVVFSGTPKAKFNFQEAFSFLNESRKLQMVKLLKESGNLPVWYPGDAEVYLRAANVLDAHGKETDELFCAFFNIGLDPIDEIELCTEAEIAAVEMLTPDGQRAECTFRNEDGKLVVETPAEILHPVMLFLKKK